MRTRISVATAMALFLLSGAVVAGVDGGSITADGVDGGSITAHGVDGGSITADGVDGSGFLNWLRLVFGLGR